MINVLVTVNGAAFLSLSALGRQNMSPQFQELISFCEVVLNQPHVPNASPPKAQVCQNPLKQEA